MHNQFLSKQNISKLEKLLLQFVNSQEDYLSVRSLDDPRSVGSALQSLVEDNFQIIVSNPELEFQTNFTRRGMADIAFSDADNVNYIIDVKTHNLDTAFSMPNLTANRRLVDLYKTDKLQPENYFMVLIFAYRIIDSKLIVEKVIFTPVENLDWECLTIGALGWGQIQIKNSNKIKLNLELTRKEWMLQLCDKMIIFYPKEITKIKERVKYFEDARDFWNLKI